MYRTVQIPIAGIDCDIIMIPTIQKKTESFELENSTFYGVNENDKFYNFINQVDSKLLQIHLEEDKSR